MAIANGLLAEADTVRMAAKTAAATHEIKRIQARDALLLHIAETELAVFKAFVGRDDLVRAILSPPRRAGSTKPADSGNDKGHDGGEDE